MAKEEPRPPSLIPPPESPPQEPPQQVDLTGLGQDIKRHWEQFLPRMSADLKRKRQFLQAVYDAQELVSKTMWRLQMRDKLPHNRAWEIARELAFYPAEEERSRAPRSRKSGPPAKITALPTPSSSAQAQSETRPEET